MVKITRQNLRFGNCWKLLPVTGNLYILSSNFAALSRPAHLLALHKPFANPHGNCQSLIYLSWRKQPRTSFLQTWDQESWACCNYLELDCCLACRRVCAVQRSNVVGRDASGQDSSQRDNPLWERKTNHGKYIVKPRNHEHQKYLWNVTASQGESPLGVRNFTLQWWLDCGFQVSSYVCNVIVIGQYTIGLSKLLSEFHCACNTAQFQNSRTLGSGNQEMLSIQPKWNGT